MILDNEDILIENVNEIANPFDKILSHFIEYKKDRNYDFYDVLRLINLIELHRYYKWKLVGDTLILTFLNKTMACQITFDYKNNILICAVNEDHPEIQVVVKRYFKPYNKMKRPGYTIYYY